MDRFQGPAQHALTKGDAIFVGTGTAVGGGSIAVGKLVEIATQAQAISMIVGCAISLVTLIYVVHRYIRFLKSDG